MRVEVFIVIIGAELREITTYKTKDHERNTPPTLVRIKTPAPKKKKKKKKPKQRKPQRRGKKK